MSLIDKDPPSSESRYVSTQQVAKALGVSVTTVKRWVDDGILPAQKTVGGHRKLLMADVIRMAREGNLPQADLGRLYPKQQNLDLTNANEICEQLYKALLLGEQDLTRGIIHGLYHHGHSMEFIADQIVRPTMHRIGHEWESGTIEVMHEHRATQTLVTVLYEMKAILRLQVERERPVAVGGAPEHDHYILPSLLSKLLMLDAGWDAINLGPHTPMMAFEAALHEYKPRLIWFSVSHLVNPEQFIREYNQFCIHAMAAGVTIVMGGSALTESIRAQLQYKIYGNNLIQLAEIARTIYPRPERPKRGRPPTQPDGTG